MVRHRTTDSESPARSRVLRIVIGICVTMTISLVFQVVGCFAPGWLLLEHKDITVHYGLWFDILCSDSESCRIVSTADVNVVPGISIMTSSSRREYRGETVGAFISCIAAIAVLLLSQRRLGSPNSNNVLRPLISGGVATVLSGVLSLIAACKVGDQTRIDAYIMTSEEGLPNQFGFPYALFLTGVGGLLALLAFLVLLIGKPWELSAENQSPTTVEPPSPTAMHPDQFTTIETGYPSIEQPQMWAVPSAPPLPAEYETGHNPSLYY